MTKIDFSNLEDSLFEVRDFTASDIEPLAAYWYDNPLSEHLLNHIDFSKLGSREAFVKKYQDFFAQKNESGNNKLPMLVVTYDSVAIACCLLNDLIIGVSADFHVHIWNQSFRGLGLSLKYSAKVFDIFFQRYRLKRLDFKIPSANKPAIRAAKNLGAKFVREETLESPLLKDQTMGHVYRLFR